jgi:hypothetical protein
MSRTRASTWVPRRAYYVLAYLRRRLTAGNAQAISNKQIQIAVRFGSEGEISQTMRWLAGDAPTSGRWSYGNLNAPQVYRFITRERLPSGGYVITLLAAPKLIDPPAPDAVQLTLWDDPSMIPPAPHQDAPDGGSCDQDPPASAGLRQQDAPNGRAQRDHPKETPEDSDQEEESAHTPLLARLLTQPGMSRSLAQRIADRAIGTLAEFEADLRIAKTFARSPFFFTVARWRDGQRVVAPEEPRHVDSARSRSATRSQRSTQAHQSGRSAPDQAAIDAEYAAMLAEIVACNPGMQV